MEGNFNISMKTPFGPQNGSIAFHEEGGKISGFLNIFGGKNPFTEGRANENNFEFSGTIRNGSNRFDYKVKGTINGSALKGTAFTKFGTLQINGTRV